MRQYPWGTIQIENEDHCDFVKLREMLVRTNMEDLREKTHDFHYEMYRYVDWFCIVKEFHLEFRCKTSVAEDLCGVGTVPLANW